MQKYTQKAKIHWKWTNQLSLPHRRTIWAATGNFQQCCMCDQQRPRPACAYAQSGQSICYSLDNYMSATLLIEHQYDFLIWLIVLPPFTISVVCCLICVCTFTLVVYITNNMDPEQHAPQEAAWSWFRMLPLFFCKSILTHTSNAKCFRNVTLINIQGLAEIIVPVRGYGRHSPNQVMIYRWSSTFIFINKCFNFW